MTKLCAEISASALTSGTRLLSAFPYVLHHYGTMLKESLKREFTNHVHADRRTVTHPYLPEGEVAVGIGVRGEVPAVRGKSHRSYRSFMAMDSLARGRENRNIED